MLNTDQAINYRAVRKKLNVLHKILQEAPDEEKLGYQLSVASILNAYREGDISFVKAYELLELKGG